eukprot:GHVT01043376.1.p1 GENE.GHVT01043376.1~~GHVT01043376.1.p1  ORF type:complete len:229 (-),score=56.93 GHVT01043376.1:274-960(-)
MQSMLAILGAVGLQSGASQDEEVVARATRRRVEEIVGASLERATEQQEELEQIIKPTKEKADGHKPLKLRYILPRNCRPDVRLPQPCVTFAPGQSVRLEPSLAGRADRRSLAWKIFPALPQASGLRFSVVTGVIEGTIPQADVALKNFPTEEKSRKAKRELNGQAQPMAMSRKTFQVSARNEFGVARARVTFQIQSADADAGGGKHGAYLSSTLGHPEPATNTSAARR